MPYCITLRSRTDARVTGWYTGRNTPWSTDHTRQKRFDNKHDASAVCHELRSSLPAQCRSHQHRNRAGRPRSQRGKLEIQVRFNQGQGFSIVGTGWNDRIACT